MATTAYWAPNQAAIQQVETYTFGTPPGAGVWALATINGKTLTYVTVLGDTATTVATAMFNLLSGEGNQGIGVLELNEVTFANPSAAVVTATATAAGTPFANVPGTTAGLVLSTGNGWANGITTVHTQANQSPSDVNDPQNWLRFTGSAPGVRQLPQNGDAVVVAGTSVPLLWNLDQLKAVQFATYRRDQTFTGTIGLPMVNINGYMEWRTQYWWFVGPQGSVPAGGLVMVLGQGEGDGPALEQYNVGSQLATLQIIGGGVVRFLGIHTLNSFTLLNGVDLEVAMQNGELATLSSSTVDSGSTLSIGPGVTWTAGSTLTLLGGTTTLYAAPATVTMANGAGATFAQDALTWATITAQGGCTLTWLAGGTITTLTLTTGCTLDKSQNVRALTITNSTIDGDTCQILDPLNSITFTNATSVKQSVTSGPIQFTGTRTVKVT